MRISRVSLDTFQRWLPGRFLLPLGFAAIVALGTYVVADDQGYQRGLAEHGPSKDLARLIVPAEDPVDLDDGAAAAKADRLELPVLIRAIEPDAVYRPNDAAKTGAARHREHIADNLPAGVERFDHCRHTCDTRDPMIVRSSAPITAAPEAPATVEAASRPASEGFLGLPAFPSLPSAGDLVDRTVEGTASAYGAMKDGAAATVDSVKGAVGGVIDLMR